MLRNSSILLYIYKSYHSTAVSRSVKLINTLQTLFSTLKYMRSFFIKNLKKFCKSLQLRHQPKAWLNQAKKESGRDWRNTCKYVWKERKYAMQARIANNSRLPSPEPAGTRPFSALQNASDAWSWAHKDKVSFHNTPNKTLKVLQLPPTCCSWWLPSPCGSAWAVWRCASPAHTASLASPPAGSPGLPPAAAVGPPAAQRESSFVSSPFLS